MPPPHGPLSLAKLKRKKVVSSTIIEESIFQLAFEAIRDKPAAKNKLSPILKVFTQLEFIYYRTNLFLYIL